MITTSFEMVEFFFDRPAITNSIDRAERKALSRIGAFVRRRARSSLRIRKRVSMPGETPSIRSRDKAASLKNILFAFQPATHSVLIGPVGLNQLTDGRTVPEIHEFGRPLLSPRSNLSKRGGLIYGFVATTGRE